MLLALVLLAATIAVYAPVQHAEFVNYDDYHYVVENGHVATGLTPENALWALGAFSAGNWHPLTWISHQLDCSLYGLEPGGHHLTSLVLHALNAVLLLLALHGLTGALWPSALVAALFALHPLNVESVAWVSERKNVLSLFFWLLTLMAYGAYARRPSAARYVRVALLLALGLASKPMVVTLPAILLLLDLWPLGRLEPGRPGATRRALELLREKLPLFALSAASSALTVMAQKGAGAVTTLDQVPLDHRLTNASVAYAAYLAKAVWPTGLSAFYPHPGGRLSPALVAGCLALLAAASLLALRAARRMPSFTVGWLWYLGSMVPVIGIVQVGSQAMADRYAYHTLIGIFVALAFGAETLLLRLALPARAALAWTLAAGALLPLALQARAQVGYWHDSIALFEHARQVTRNNYVAYTNLGLAYNKQKRWETAISHFDQALRIHPRSAEAWGHRGLALARLGRVDDAIASLERALAIYPDSEHAHNNLGIALRKRDPEKAIAHLRRAVELAPEFAEARVNLGAALLERGQLAEAQRCFEEARALDSGSAVTRFRLGSVHLERGELDLAQAELEAALDLDPTRADSHNSLGVVRLRQGDLAGALQQFETTLRIEPEHADAVANLGIVLMRRGQRAEAQARLAQAIRLNPKHADAHASLGALLAQDGQLDQALPHFRAAVEADPDNAVGLNNLGAALLQKNDVAGALEYLERAVRANPRHADAQSNLGVALLLKGDAAGALEHLQAALAIAPGHANARRYLEQAEALRRQARAGEQ